MPRKTKFFPSSVRNDDVCFFSPLKINRKHFSQYGHLDNVKIVFFYKTHMYRKHLSLRV